MNVAVLLASEGVHHLTSDTSLKTLRQLFEGSSKITYFTFAKNSTFYYITALEAMRALLTAPEQTPLSALQCNPLALIESHLDVTTLFKTTPPMPPPLGVLNEHKHLIGLITPESFNHGLHKAYTELTAQYNTHTWDMIELNDDYYKSLDRLHLTQEIAQIGDWELDLKSGTLFASPVFQSILHLPNKTLFNAASLATHFPKGIVPKEHHKALYENPEPLHFHHIHTHNETTYHTHFICQVFRDDLGEPLRLIGTAQDITSRKAAEAKEKAQERVMIQQSKMAAMGEMIGVIAHQWKQPLNTLSLLIQATVEDIEEGESDLNAIQEFERMSLHQISFMVHTIDDFRNFFKPSREVVHFDTQDALKTVLTILKPQLTSYHITVNTHIQNPKTTTKGFRNDFNQVLLNLLNNAKDVIEEHHLPLSKRLIDITFKSDNVHLVITIKDYAGGIPESVMNTLFEPYISTKGDQGTGIGLSMSKTIIERMEGRLEAENDTEGAVFTITLPCL